MMMTMMCRYWVWVPPFLILFLGELEADAVTLFKRIQKFSITQYIGARAAFHIFSGISFVIAKGVGAQIV